MIGERENGREGAWGMVNAQRKISIGYQEGGDLFTISVPISYLPSSYFDNGPQTTDNGHAMEFPDTLRYTKNHEWVRLSDDGKTATIGITAFAQSELGDIVFVEVDTVGEALESGAVFGTVEAVKAVSDLFMPISGTVAALNDDLEGSPELINEDPYGAGWMIKIEIDDPGALGDLLSAADYAEMVG